MYKRLEGFQFEGPDTGNCDTHSLSVFFFNTAGPFDIVVRQLTINRLINKVINKNFFKNNSYHCFSFFVSYVIGLNFFKVYIFGNQCLV